MVSNGWKISGLILGILLIGLLVLAGSAAAEGDTVTVTASADPGEPAIDAGTGPVVPETAATLNKTFFLHNTSSAFIINGLSTIRYADTIANSSLSGGDVVTANKDIVGLTWVVYPVLAEDVTLVGGDLKLWISRPAGTNTGGNFDFQLIDLAPGGAQTLIEDELALPPGFGFPSAPTEHTMTIDWPSPVTVLAGHTIIAQFDLKGNNAVTYSVHWGNATFPSRMRLQTLEHADPDTVVTLNSSGGAQSIFFPAVTTPEIEIYSNISDPFGLYDVSNVTVEIFNSTGVTFVNETNMTQLDGFFNSAFGHWNYNFNYTGWAINKYTARVRVVDNAGFYSRYPNNPGDTTWGGHLMILDRDFWIGTQPIEANITVVDSMNNPVANVTVRSAPGIQNVTDALGFTKVEVSNNTPVDLIYQGVDVGPDTVNFTADRNATLTARIYAPTFRALDSQANPVDRVIFFVTHANGTPYPSSLSTNSTGRFDLGLIPAGDYPMQGYLRSILVWDGSVTVDRNGDIDLNVTVYTLNVTVYDSQVPGNPLQNTVVSLYENATGILTDAKLTNSSGMTWFIVPGTVYDVEVTLNSVGIGGVDNYTLSGDQILRINATIYAVNVTVEDQANVLVAGAVVRITDGNGDIIGEDTTDGTGLVVIQIAAGTQTFRVRWSGSVVYLADILVTGNQNITLVTDIWTTRVLVVDDLGSPLVGADLLMTNSGSGLTLVSAKTDALGGVDVRLPAGGYATSVQWFGIGVYSGLVNITSAANITLNATVFAVTITVLDQDAATVADVQVRFDHVATGQTLVAGTTSGAGTLDAQLPGGDYRVTATWRTVLVLDVNQTVNASGNLSFTANIYNFAAQVRDDLGALVAGATIDLSFDFRAEQDSYVTNGAGSANLRLPAWTYTIDVYWQGVPVGSFARTADGTNWVFWVNIYVVTFSVVDQDAVPLADTTLAGVHQSSGQSLLAGITDASGDLGARLPAGNYQITGDWKTIQVLDTLVPVTSSGTITLVADVISFTLTVNDDLGFPLEATSVRVVFSGTTESITGVTNATGQLGLRLPMMNHDVTLTWRGVVVGNDLILADGTDITLTSDVYHVVFEIIDLVGDPLEDTTLAGTHQGTMQLLLAGITNASGQLGDRLPIGTYRILGDWRTILILDELVLVDASGTITLVADVVGFTITVQDDLGLPLEATTVDVVFNGTNETVTGVTDANGNLEMRLPMMDHDVTLTWRGVMVGNQVITADGSDMTLTADVYHVTFVIVDRSNATLEDTTLAGTHLVTAQLLLAGITDAAGTLGDRLPGGDYRIAGDWRTILVLDTEVTVNASGNITLIADVVQFTLTVQDDLGLPLETTTVDVVFNGTNETVTGITDANGTLDLRLPMMDHSVTLTWRGVEVGNELITANVTDLTLTAMVYHVTFPITDMDGLALGDATFAATHDATSQLLLGAITPTDGTVGGRLPVGTYTVTADWRTISVIDESLNISTSGAIPLTATVSTFIITILDDVGDPVPNAAVTVDFVASPEVDTRTTDSAGATILRLPHWDYSVDVVWREVAVGNFDLPFSGADVSYTVSVYPLTFVIQDQDGLALDAATLEVVHLASDRLMTGGSTGSAGTVVDRLPGADYSVKVEWQGIEVLDSTLTLTNSGDHVYAARVVTVSFAITDQDGLALPDAAFIAEHVASGQTLLAGATAVDGTIGKRLPMGDYSISAVWQAIEVLSTTTDLSVSETQTFAAAVVTVTFYLEDLDLLPVADAAFVATHVASGQDLLTGASDASGSIGARLPMGAYAVSAVWEAITVVDTDLDLTVSGAITLATDVAAFTITLEDSRGVGVEDATVTLTYAELGTVVSLTTDSMGVTSVRLPVWNYTIGTTWMGVAVGTFEHTNDNNDTILAVAVSYIDVSVVDRNGGAYAGAEIKVLKGTQIIAAMVSDDAGAAVFRLPDQTYRVQLDYQDTQWWTFVAETHEQTTTLAGDQTAAFELVDFPVPIYKRILLWMVVAMMIMLGLLVWLFMRGRKPGAEEEASVDADTSEFSDGDTAVAEVTDGDTAEAQVTDGDAEIQGGTGAAAVGAIGAVVSEEATTDGQFTDQTCPTCNSGLITQNDGLFCTFCDKTIGDVPNPEGAPPPPPPA